ncbi:hypothetical protein EV421DRAFT_855719 [Armillaria borealis]|uniref:Uncharacterized protein n=1 Tax=Armillaria borealis TaxID=47425 RepID=A0AA39JAS5_9AGAR|nr:hypothetical protein EV421DRAFT_855719 [Armillaria borealis]
MLGSSLIYLACVVNCTQPLNLSAWTVASAALRHASSSGFCLHFCSYFNFPLWYNLESMILKMIPERSCLTNSAWLLLTHFVLVFHRLVFWTVPASSFLVAQSI